MPSPEYIKHVDQRYERAVLLAAQRLRNMVDDFERSALDLKPGSSQGQYPRTAAASRAVHALTWGLANASVESIIRDGAEADVAHREEKQNVERG